MPKNSVIFGEKLRNLRDIFSPKTSDFEETEKTFVPAQTHPLAPLPFTSCCLPPPTSPCPSLREISMRIEPWPALANHFLSCNFLDIYAILWRAASKQNKFLFDRHTLSIDHLWSVKASRWQFLWSLRVSHKAFDWWQAHSLSRHGCPAMTLWLQVARLLWKILPSPRFEIPQPSQSPCDSQPSSYTSCSTGGLAYFTVGRIKPWSPT